MARSIGAMGWQPARRNVVALFPQMKDARAAIDALEAHGFDAGTISLEGPRADRASEREDTRRRDAGVTGTVAARVIAGASIGAAIGLGTGVLVVAFTAGAELIPMLIAALAGTVGGGSIGMMLAGVGTLDVTPDWELTFERDSAGRIMVAVGSEDRKQAQEAADVLHDLNPLSVKQVDAAGLPL
ncbi:MAG: hypothetical protein WAT66_14505 [Actinomycetota bacterium]